jgi:hypothetical protein
MNPGDTVWWHCDVSSQDYNIMTKTRLLTKHLPDVPRSRSRAFW